MRAKAGGRFDRIAGGANKEPAEPTDLQWFRGERLLQRPRFPRRENPMSPTESRTSATQPSSRLARRLQFHLTRLHLTGFVLHLGWKGKRRPRLCASIQLDPSSICLPIRKPLPQMNGVRPSSRARMPRGIRSRYRPVLVRQAPTRRTVRADPCRFGLRVSVSASTHPSRCSLGGCPSRTRHRRSARPVPGLEPDQERRQR